MVKEKIEENDQIEMNNVGNSVLLPKFSSQAGDFNHFLLIIIDMQRSLFFKLADYFASLNIWTRN